MNFDRAGRPGRATFVWAVRLCRAQIVGLTFVGMTLLGVACIAAGQTLDLLAFDDPGLRVWELGVATAVSLGVLWSLGGTQDAADSGTLDALDATPLGAFGRWTGGTLARWGGGIVLGSVLLLYTIASYTHMPTSVLSTSMVASAFLWVVASSAFACAWARALGTWLSGSAASLLALGLWVAGQSVVSPGWSGWLPPSIATAHLDVRRGCSDLALLAALMLLAWARVEHRRTR